MLTLDTWNRSSGFRIEGQRSKSDASAWRWDENRTRIVISQWDPALSPSATLKILPGTRD
jgi:hypothetical protein